MDGVGVESCKPVRCLHDNAVLLAAHLVDNAAGVARAPAASPARQVHDEHARVLAVHLGREVVPEERAVSKQELSLRS